MATFVASIRTAKHAPARARKLISLNPDPGNFRFTTQVAVTDNSSAARPYSPVSAESKKQMIQTAPAARAGSTRAPVSDATASASRTKPRKTTMEPDMRTSGGDQKTTANRKNSLRLDRKSVV